MVAFDHAEDSFDLPALSVDFSIESPLHQATILAAKRFGSWTAMFGRYRTANVVCLASKAVIGFTVVAGIGENVLESRGELKVSGTFFSLATRGWFVI